MVWKIHSALLTALCGFSSVLQHERRQADVHVSHQSILWHLRPHALQICLKSFLATQINWSLDGNATEDISALASSKAFQQNFLTLQKIILSAKSIVRSWYCLLLNSKFIPLCVLALWDAIIPVAVKTSSYIWISPVFHLPQKRNKEMHFFFFWIKPLSFLRKRLA